MLTLIKLGKKAGHSTSAEQGKFRRAKTPPEGGGDNKVVGQVGEGCRLISHDISWMDRSMAGYGNTPMSYPAVDVYSCKHLH